MVDAVNQWAALMLCLFTTAAAALSTAVLATPEASENVATMVLGAQMGKVDFACRLCNSPRNVPFSLGMAGEIRARRGHDGAVCVFRGLAPGRYALVVALLPDGEPDITRDF